MQMCGTGSMLCSEHVEFIIRGCRQGGGAAARHPHPGVLRALRHGLRVHHRAHPGVRPGLPHRRRGRAAGAHPYTLSANPYPLQARATLRKTTGFAQKRPIFLRCFCFMTPRHAPSSEEGLCALALHAHAHIFWYTMDLSTPKWVLSSPLSVLWCLRTGSARLLVCPQGVRRAVCEIQLLLLCCIG